MQFFTKVPIFTTTNPINYQSKIILIGSCFAENISAKFQYYKFQHTGNPFGIIFNPISLEKLIQRATEKKQFTEADIFFHDERWHCFEVHSELSHPNKDLYLQNLNSTLAFLYKEIGTATHFIITLGTSWVYKTIINAEVVANCHKVPQKEFSKHLLSTVEISESLFNIVNLVHSINPSCSFIATVSPVRHLKDGFFENQTSKSHLIAAVFDLIRVKKLELNYFPSFEIMMDELRDYRFYSADLLHPNTTAIDYIWSRFAENYIEQSSHNVMSQVELIQKSLQHKPFNAASTSHQKFLKNLNKKIEKLQSDNPFITFLNK